MSSTFFVHLSSHSLPMTKEAYGISKHSLCFAAAEVICMEALRDY